MISYSTPSRPANDETLEAYSHFSHLFNYRSSATAMEIVTHLINDTIEFYKWTLTIAGIKSCNLVVLF